MSRIVLLIENPENRRLLAEWLATSHDVAADPEAAFETEFDLGIVDGPSLERNARRIEAVKRATHPVFLPFLLVTPRRGGYSDAWKSIDEVIVTPIEKLELEARVEALLRARALSVENATLARCLERELVRAREVQNGLLPSDPPQLRGFDLAARCIPANEVGGDFFDWQALGGAAVVSVGDVMGKGIPAALLAAMVRSVLRAVSQQNAPGAALELLRQALFGDLERTSSFVTLFHARVLECSGEVRYVDAGHGHALVRRASGAVERLERGGRPVGFPMPTSYREAALRLAPGDVLFIYSDGLIEGTHRDAKQLIDELEVDVPASAIVDQLVKRAPTTGSVDDVTALVLKCTAPGP